MAFSSKPLPADVIDALQRGNTIGAIKLLRASTGLGLKEAKEVIDGYLQSNSRMLPSQAPAGPLPAAVASALQQGNKIEAIRLLREQTGLGLKEAKDAIDASMGGGQPADNGPSPGEVTRTGGFSWWLAAAGIVAVAAYYLLRSPG
jgi:ribosomal protein L7/L12